MEGKAEGSESSDGFRGKDTKTDENPHVEIMDSYNDSNKIFEQIPDNASNNAMTKDGKMLDNAIRAFRLILRFKPSKRFNQTKQNTSYWPF